METTSLPADPAGGPFVPVQPLSRDEFRAFVVAADARIPQPGTLGGSGLDPDLAQRYRNDLCGGEISLLALPIFTYPSAAAEYEVIFDDLAARCDVTGDYLDRARGEAAWSMSGNQLAVDRMTTPEPTAMNRFCDVLGGTDSLTSQLIADAAQAAGLVPSSAGDVVQLGASLLLQGCPVLLGAVRG